MAKTIKLAVLLALFGAGVVAETPVPTRLELMTWGGPGSTRFGVLVEGDGMLKLRRESLPLTTDGPTTRTFSTRLSATDRASIFALAADATDFDLGCMTVADGTSARLRVTLEGGVSVRECVMAQEWPVGGKTKLFLEKLNSFLPKKLHVY